MTVARESIIVGDGCVHFEPYVDTNVLVPLPRKRKTMVCFDGVG